MKCESLWDQPYNTGLFKNVKTWQVAMFRIGMDRSDFRRSRCKLFEQTEEKFCKRLLYSALTCLNVVNIQSETVKYCSFLQKKNCLHFVDSHCFVFSGEHDKTLEMLRVAQMWLLTGYGDRSPFFFLETEGHSALQAFLRLLCHTNFHNRVHNSPPLKSVLSPFLQEKL